MSCRHPRNETDWTWTGRRHGRSQSSHSATGVHRPRDTRGHFLPRTAHCLCRVPPLLCCAVCRAGGQTPFHAVSVESDGGVLVSEITLPASATLTRQRHPLYHSVTFPQLTDCSCILLHVCLSCTLLPGTHCTDTASSSEASRRSSRGLVPCQWVLSLSVSSHTTSFESAWLPSPTSLLAIAACHFRELLTATASPHRSEVNLLTVPCAYIPHEAGSGHVQLQYSVDERSGEPGPVTLLGSEQHWERQLHDDGGRASGELAGCGVLAVLQAVWLGQLK